MAVRDSNEHVRIEADEPCSPFVAFTVGLQGVMLVLAPTVLIVTITVRSSGLDDNYLTWAVFAALIINALTTGLQAIQIRRVGAGHLVISGPTTLFIGIATVALSGAGPATMASLLVVCSLLQLALAWWLPLLRRIVTPVVSGTVMMLIGGTVLPIAFDNVQTLPEGSSSIAGPIVATTTLFVSVALTLRATGSLRLFGPIVSIIVGSIAALAFGGLDLHGVGEAPWFGLPPLPQFGFDLTLRSEFWALLPTFAILTLVLGINTATAGIAIQQASRRLPRSIDFRQVQSMVGVNALGMLLAGIAGTLPTLAYSPFVLSLIYATGVAARRVGIVIAVLFIVLAFSAKFTALLTAIPGPVAAAYLMLAMGLFFVGGVRTILQDGLDQQRALIIAVSFALGLGLHNHTITQDILGKDLGAMLGNGVMIGTLVAMALTWFVEVSSVRSRRLEAELDISSLPALSQFLGDIGSSLKWNERSKHRLDSVGEETLSSLLTTDESQSTEDQSTEGQRRLVVNARPEPGLVELEFIATTNQENIEDQLAYLSDEAELPTADDISLRLLRYHAASVRHQKFYGVDIVTVQVEGSV